MDTSNSLRPVERSLPASLQESAERAKDYARQAKAPNTVRAYRRDWQDFSAWCEARGLAVLPAGEETVAVYITELAERVKASTIQRRLTAISQAHKLKGLPSPTKGAAAVVWAGIRRAKGTAQVGKEPVLTDDIRRMVRALPEDLRGLRDRALLLVGFAGALRRSELVGLDVSDLEFRREGLALTLRRSKTDQEGVGHRIGIPYGSHPETCPVRTLRAWLEAAEITDGPVFRPTKRSGVVLPERLSDRAVARVVQRTAKAAGLDPARFAGHSLRAGLATAAAMAGVAERVIMQQTRHKSLPMVRRYIREGSLFRENAAAEIGL